MFTAEYGVLIQHVGIGLLDALAGTLSASENTRLPGGIPGAPFEIMPLV
jgi:hypothetical protein